MYVFSDSSLPFLVSLKTNLIVKVLTTDTHRKLVYLESSTCLTSINLVQSYEVLLILPPPITLIMLKTRKFNRFVTYHCIQEDF